MLLPGFRMQFTGLLAFALLMCFTGCGDGNMATYPVKGSIKFEGGGVPKFGTIEFFHPEKKINARGIISSDGTFTVGTYTSDDGAIEGEHQIVIHQVVTNHLSANAKVEIHHNHGKEASAKYRDYRTSGLKCTIKPGSNDVELEITAMKH